jgi:hypothetical protein
MKKALFLLFAVVTFPNFESLAFAKRNNPSSLLPKAEYQLKIDSKEWNVRDRNHKRQGIVLSAEPKSQKLIIKNISVYKNKFKTNLKIDQICKAAVQGNSQFRISSNQKIINSNGNSFCKIEYPKDSIEQFIFVTKSRTPYTLTVSYHKNQKTKDSTIVSKLFY